MVVGFRVPVRNMPAVGFWVFGLFALTRHHKIASIALVLGFEESSGGQMPSGSSLQYKYQGSELLGKRRSAAWLLRLS